MAKAAPTVAESLSATQLAALLDLAPRSIRELAERGIIPRDAGRYRLQAALHANRHEPAHYSLSI